MTIIEQMLNKYDEFTINKDPKNVIKEVLQEVILAGLAKTDFFTYAAFYGGTALRLFYDMERFSEDLDFSLLVPDPNFTLEKYFPSITSALKSLGFDFKVAVKDKTKLSNILSAFVKGNTQETILSIFPHTSRNFPHNDVINIKFEIDLNPPPFAHTEIKYRLLPFPYAVRIYDKSSLFAGKVHAVIARSWRNRVKGRDLYDFIYYLSLGTKLNLKHLTARLHQTNTIPLHTSLTRESLISLLTKRFETIDFTSAKLDVLKFINDPTVLDVWSTAFFIEIARNIEVI